VATEDLCPPARAALDDFDYFRHRYLARRPTPWQKAAAESILEWLLTPHKEFVVINCPPGSGKSTLFTHDIPLWLLCKDRSLRCMIGSRTERQAAGYTGRIRRTLSQRIRPDGAETTLMHDFGSFRPAERDIWRRGEFVVAQPGVHDAIEKEPTFSAYGYDSAFLGGRFDLVVWDDLVDRHVLKTVDAREAMERFWAEEAETRLEPGGLLVLQGQRLDSDDLYRHALDLQLEDGSPKYRHIRYPAHDTEHCDSAHGTDAPYWPQGCLLDPVRVPWRDIAAVRLKSTSRFETVYQQNDFDQSSALVRELWLAGGTESGVTYRGCWDPRKAGHVPMVDPRAAVSIVGVDPSPTRDWGITWWLYDRASECRHLVDIYVGRLSVPELLDLNYQTGVFSGLMHAWQQRSVAAGHPIRYWVVEVNAAQRFLLQMPQTQRWAAQQRCDLIPHSTGARKRDPDYGPNILGGLYRDGLCRLPGHSKDKVAPLIEDLLRWSPDSTFTHDALMSQWFVEANLAALAPGGAGYQKWTPSWVGGNRAWVAS